MMMIMIAVSTMLAVTATMIANVKRPQSSGFAVAIRRGIDLTRGHEIVAYRAEGDKGCQ